MDLGPLVEAIDNLRKAIKADAPTEEETVVGRLKKLRGELEVLASWDVQVAYEEEGRTVSCTLGADDDP